VHAQPKIARIIKFIFFSRAREDDLVKLGPVPTTAEQLQEKELDTSLKTSQSGETFLRYL